MRTVVSWAWFRPSENAWDEGARWYRCDVVGGGEQSKRFVELPTTARGLLQGQPKDRWLVCVNGDLGEHLAEDPVHRAAQLARGDHDQGRRARGPLPRRPARRGDDPRLLPESVGAWLGYPPEYEFGYTWFHEGEWKAGNRRSVCWAKTSA